VQHSQVSRLWSNSTAIPNGPIAVVDIQVDRGAAGKQEIQISQALASSPDGKAMRLLSSNGLVIIAGRTRLGGER